MVVGLKTELGQFLHFMCCTAEQLFWLRSSSAEGWALLRLVLSQNMYWNGSFWEVSKWLVT